MRRLIGLALVLMVLPPLLGALAPRNAAADSFPTGSIYWDNPQGPAVGSASIYGENPGNINQAFGTGIRQLFRLGVAADRQYVYWTDGLQISRANRNGTGGVTRQFVQLPSAAMMLALDNQHIYFVAGSYIGRANVEDGKNVEPRFMHAGGYAVKGLAVDAFYIYWTYVTDLSGHTAVARAKLDGTGIEPSFIPDAGGAQGIAVDGQHVYWADATAGAIKRANLVGTGVESSFITGAVNPMGVTVDFEHVYWANTFNCNYHTQPPSACGGGTLGRANLDGSDVNQTYVTADTRTGPGCNTAPQTRCGPFSVALNAPTQPACLRTSPPPVPPPGGAVFARPLDSGSTDANVVVVPAGTQWSATGPCTGVAVGAAQVMTQPTSISVAPGVAVLLHDEPAGLLSVWGAKNVAVGDPTPVLFPGRSDWQTTKAELLAPDVLLNTFGGCAGCELPNNVHYAAGNSLPTIAHQRDLSGATLTGAVLSGNLAGWDFSGASLAGASFSGADVSAAQFTGADVRGVHVASLQATAPPTFAKLRVGQFNGVCTTFDGVDLVNTSLSLAQTTTGCASSPLLPHSSVPVSLIASVHADPNLGSNVNLTRAIFVAQASDRSSLAGLDLHGIDLTEASFVGWPVDLSGTHLDGASLQQASLAQAEMSGASLTNVHAPGAVFAGAHMAGRGSVPSATFAGSQTNLQGATFFGADVSGVSFANADLSPDPTTGNATLFDHALAVNTDFTGVHAPRASFIEAHIYGNSGAFAQANDLSGADFADALLAGDSQEGGLDLSKVPLSGAHFDGAQCVACNFEGAQLDTASFAGAYLPGAILANTTLTGNDMANAWLYCGDSGNSACAPVVGSRAAVQQEASACTRLSLAPGMLIKATEDPAIDLVDRDCQRRPVVNDATLRQVEQTYHRTVRQLVPTELQRLVVGPPLPDADTDPAGLQQAVQDFFASDAAASAQTPADQEWEWPLDLAFGENYAHVRFKTTDLENTLIIGGTCPNGLHPQNSNIGCTGDELLPRGSMPALPIVCSDDGGRGAAGMEACPTLTSTVPDGTDAGKPLAVTAAVPPTWATRLVTKGYHVGFADGTILLVGNGAPKVVATQLGRPAGLAVGLDGSLYVADPSQHMVHRVDPTGHVTNVAGNGQSCDAPTSTCGDAGPATDAQLGGPNGVWVDPSGRIWIADDRRGLREVLPDGTITSVASTVGTYALQGIVGDRTGQLYAATTGPDYLIQLDPASGQVTRVVGTGTSGYNGTSNDNGNLLPADQVQVNQPMGLALRPDGAVLFADSGNHLVRAYVPAFKHVVDLGGLVDEDGIPQGGFNGDNQWADQTELNQPLGVTATGVADSVFVVADTANNRVRLLGPTPLDESAGPPPPP